MFKICLPGTGGMAPLPERFLACCWMQYQGGAVLIDCGEGTQVALKKSGCHLSKLRLMLLTHYHADHVAGLPGLLLTLGNTGKKTPLYIVGPPGLQAVVSALCVLAPALPYPVRLCELDGAFQKLEGWEGLSVSVLPLRHWVPCLGYRVDIARKPIFNPEKAKGLGVKPVDFKRLHAGEPVTLADGRTIEPAQVIDGERAPLRVCYCTDTLAFDGIAPFAKGSGLLILEGMYGDESMRAKVEEKRHMLFSDSARLAAKAGAQRLWLTHFSPALTQPEAFEDAARAIFPASQAAKDGQWLEL